MGVSPVANQANLRHGQALALQYALQVLVNSSQSPQVIERSLTEAQLAAANAIPTAALGCEYATRVLSPFVVELALKALIAKHGDSQVAHGHELSELFDDLPLGAQGDLEREFEHMKQSDMLAETRSLREILAAHSRDFTGWRYLDDPKSLEADPIDMLQYIGCAVLNVYNAN